jgi:hypothetical protein
MGKRDKGASAQWSRVGMARCAVPARDRRRNGTEKRRVDLGAFRRLILRSATGKAQRAIPARLRLVSRAVRECARRTINL